MTSIGEMLRSERLKRNLALEHISGELKISSRFLEAIEEERFDRLPGGVFVRSFVRQYARYLGLDEEELAAEAQRAVDPVPALPNPPEQAPPVSEIRVPRVAEWELGSGGRFQWSSTLPALALVVVVMLVCSGVYTWWQRTRTSVSAHNSTPAAVATQAQVQPASQPAPAQPEATAAPAGEPGQPADASSASRQEPEPAAGGTAETQPANAAASNANPANAPSQPAPAPGTEAAASGAAAHPETSAGPVAASAQTTPAPGTEPGAPSSGAVRVEITALEPVWVLAQKDGKYLFSGTMEPGKTRTVEADKTVLLRLGNAAAVSVLLNGKPVGPLGTRGQVRTLQLTPGGFTIVASPKPSLPPDDIL